jgi:hypothetical protein
LHSGPLSVERMRLTSEFSETAAIKSRNKIKRHRLKEKNSAAEL